MHGALKAVIVNANSELQRGAGPTEEVDPAIALTDGRMDVEGSGDFLATIMENDRSANFDVASVPPVGSEAATIPAEPTAFGNIQIYCQQLSGVPKSRTIVDTA